MTVVLVHGVPETPALWDPPAGPCSAATTSRRCRSPASAAPAPTASAPRRRSTSTGWSASSSRRQGGEPIDLVGHDWGGGFTVRLVSTRPDLVRSWVTDAAGIGDVDFEWHDFAKIWQTPGDGRGVLGQQLAASLDERAAVFELSGVPHDGAIDAGRGSTRPWPTASSRSTDRPSTWGRSGAPTSPTSPPPGLVLIPSEDPFLAADSAAAGRERTGAVGRRARRASATGGCCRTRAKGAGALTQVLGDALGQQEAVGGLGRPPGREVRRRREVEAALVGIVGGGVEAGQRVLDQVGVVVQRRPGWPAR